ncbi:MAG: hypothetical protein ACI8S6_005619, partial [Myxococcota bacterium]
APPAAQPPIQAMLSVHVEPLPRDILQPCENTDYSLCGAPLGPPFRRRTRNLTWLLSTWAETDRTVSILLGPESSLAWTGDARMRGWLAEELGEEQLDSVTEAMWSALEEARDSERATLGAHVHSTVFDDSGLLGTAPPSAPGGPGPCEAWEADPLNPTDPAVTEAVISLGVTAAAQVADALGMTLGSFSGHVPRTLEEKIAILESPEVWGEPAFQPVSLSKGYSECFEQAVDHPPFEGYRTDGQSALGVGEGPIVLPGERSLGSMAVHLDEDSDASLGAARRRLLQLLLNRRHAALTGEEDRPWLYTFFTHDYQLNPSGDDPARDEVLPQEGHAFREDLLGIASDIDALVAMDGWMGDAGPVAEWRRADEISVEGSRFRYADDEGGAPLEGLVSSAYPYLPLVAERLAETHLACADTIGEVAVFRMLRCAGGWGWGEGFFCSQPAEAVWVLVPPGADACVSVPGGALRAAAIDAESLGPARFCVGGGLSVPAEGLIVEPGDARWWQDGCSR